MRTFVATLVLLGMANAGFCQETSPGKPALMGPSASAMASLPTSPGKTDVPQVLVSVRVLELSRTKLEAAGFNLSDGSSNRPRSAIDAILKREDSGKASTLFSYKQTVSGMFDSKDHLFAVLDALRKDGVIKVLTEPKIVVLSGQPAVFHSFPCSHVSIPTRHRDGTVSLESEECGTMIDLLPVVSANETIRLKCRVEVSKTDSAHCERTRTMVTNSDIHSGQTFVVGGFVQDHSVKKDDVAPLLSPVLIVERIIVSA